MMMVGGVSLLSEFKSANPDFGNNSDKKLDQFNATFNKLDDVTKNIDTMESSIVNATTEEGTFGTLNSLIKGAWNTIKMLFTSFGFMTAVFGGISTFFGIPLWVVNLTFAIITVVLIFSVLSAILQREL